MRVSELCSIFCVCAGTQTEGSLVYSVYSGCEYRLPQGYGFWDRPKDRWGNQAQYGEYGKTRQTLWSSSAFLYGLAADKIPNSASSAPAGSGMHLS